MILGFIAAIATTGFRTCYGIQVSHGRTLAVRRAVNGRIAVRIVKTDKGKQGPVHRDNNTATRHEWDQADSVYIRHLLLQQNSVGFAESSASFQLVC